VLWRMGVLWQFPAYAVALGSSYFQRLLVALPHLAAAVRCVPSLHGYWEQLEELGAGGHQVGEDSVCVENVPGVTSEGRGASCNATVCPCVQAVGSARMQPAKPHSSW
jgi:hypothetical protein